MTDAMHSTPTPLHNKLEVDTSAALFDYRLLFLWAGFVLRSVKRHPWVALSSFASLAFLVVALVLIVPPKYHVEAVLLANRNSMLASLGNPNRNISADMDGPLLAARETVMAHKNMALMVRQLGLVEHWKEVRNPLLRMKDRLKELLSKKLTDEERVEDMVDILEKRLVVYTGPNWTVNIEVYWPDASMARRIVETAQQNFLEARHMAEVSAILEVISILENHIAGNETFIEQAVDDMEKAVKAHRASRQERASFPTSAAGKASPRALEDANAPMLAQLQRSIRSRTRALEDFEEYRKRRLAELHNHLREQSMVYAPSHPNIRDLERRIQATREDSTQMASLRREIEQLTNEYRRLSGREPEMDFLSGRALPGANRGGDFLEPLSEREDDPSLLVAREKLRMAVANLQEFQMRLNSARIELDAAGAAFEYRYNIVKPAQTPRRPLSPNRPLIGLVGLFLCALTSLFLCFLLDFLGGRIIEAWQVEQRFKLPVLSDSEG